MHDRACWQLSQTREMLRSKIFSESFLEGDLPNEHQKQAIFRDRENRELSNLYANHVIEMVEDAFSTRRISARREGQTRENQEAENSTETKGGEII